VPGVLGRVGRAIVIVALVASCGSSVATGSGTPPARSDEPDGRPRVVLVGDSMMASLAPALRAALVRAGARARFQLYPQLPRIADEVAPSAARLAEDADLIVLMLGIWEGSSVRGGQKDGVDPDEPDWQERYRELYVRPWLQAATQDGTRVIWIGMTRVDDPYVSLGMGLLNGTFRAEVASAYPLARFVDAGGLLADPDGHFQPTVVGADGVEHRLTAVDGTHLCPDGAALVTDAVLRQLPVRLALTPDPGWREHTDWTAHDHFMQRDWYEPERCG